MLSVQIDVASSATDVSALRDPVDLVAWSEILRVLVAVRLKHWPTYVFQDHSVTNLKSEYRLAFGDSEV